MRLHDYFCKKCCKVFEEIVENDNEKVKCDCGSLATRVLNSPRMNTPTRGMFGTRNDHWRHTLNAEEDLKHEYKAIEERGELGLVDDRERWPTGKV